MPNDKELMVRRTPQGTNEWFIYDAEAQQWIPLASFDPNVALTLAGYDAIHYEPDGIGFHLHNAQAAQWEDDKGQAVQSTPAMDALVPGYRPPAGQQPTGTSATPAPTSGAKAAAGGTAAPGSQQWYAQQQKAGTLPAPAAGQEPTGDAATGADDGYGPPPKGWDPTIHWPPMKQVTTYEFGVANGTKKVFDIDTYQQERTRLEKMASATPPLMFNSLEEGQAYRDSTPGAQGFDVGLDPETGKFVLREKDPDADQKIKSGWMNYIAEAFIDGDTETAQKLLDFMNQPTEMERMRAAIDVARSPGDYFTLYAMMNGSLPIQAHPGTFERVAPESQAFSFFGFGKDSEGRLTKTNEKRDVALQQAQQKAVAQAGAAPPGGSEVAGGPESGPGPTVPMTPERQAQIDALKRAQGAPGATIDMQRNGQGAFTFSRGPVQEPFQPNGLESGPGPTTERSRFGIETWQDPQTGKSYQGAPDARGQWSWAPAGAAPNVGEINNQELAGGTEFGPGPFNPGPLSTEVAPGVRFNPVSGNSLTPTPDEKQATFGLEDVNAPPVFDPDTGRMLPGGQGTRLRTSPVYSDPGQEAARRALEPNRPPSGATLLPGGGTAFRPFAETEADRYQRESLAKIRAEEAARATMQPTGSASGAGMSNDQYDTPTNPISGGNTGLFDRPGFEFLKTVGLQGGAFGPQKQFPELGSLKFPSGQAWRNMTPSQREMYQAAVETQGIPWKDYQQQWERTLPGGGGFSGGTTYAPRRIRSYA